MRDQPSEGRKVAEAILAALEKEHASACAEEDVVAVELRNATTEDREKAEGLREFAHGKQVGCYWAHDAARRVYHDFFGEWPPNPGN